MDKLKLIKVLWNYMKIDDVPRRADCMIVLGTSRIDIVDYACSLYFKGICLLFLKIILNKLRFSFFAIILPPVKINNHYIFHLKL